MILTRRRTTILFFIIGLVVAMLAGWIAVPAALYESIEQPLGFSHVVHTSDDTGMVCDDCHHLTSEGGFAGIPKIAICEGCHEEAIGTSKDELRLVEEYVKPGREIPWLVYARQPDNAFFPHVRHTRLAKIPCEQCHGDHGKTETLRPLKRNRFTGYSRDIWGHDFSGITTSPPNSMKMSDCVDCHRKRGVRDSCLACHK